MPQSNDNLIVTGAGDCQVQLHDLNRHQEDTGSVRVYRSHFGRVKRIEVSPEEPNLLWSGGEDGLVM